MSLRSTEGPGDFDPDPTFMAQNPDLVEMSVAGGAPPPATAVSSRLLYPPRVDDMSPGLNLLHLYGWEEGELPAHWVADFNQYLHGITTMSRFVSKVLIDNGVTVPQVVAGVGVDHWERIEEDLILLTCCLRVLLGLPFCMCRRVSPEKASMFCCEHGEGLLL